MDLTPEYWNNRYISNNYQWDIGTISTPLKEYIDQLDNINLKIFIPGAGNSYEAEYLFNNGFKNVYLIDYAQQALDNFKERVPNFPKEQLICENFFDYVSDTSYDLILEQTFFCAINPNLRNSYIQHSHNLLSDKGKLVGLLFNIPLNNDKPPFGGNKVDYINQFSQVYSKVSMEVCYNSIGPRKGNELFIQCMK